MGKGWDFTAAALYQFPNLSTGPSGVDVCYSRWSKLPEIYMSMKHVGEHFTIGVGVDALSITPRKTSFIDREVTLDDGSTQMQSVEVRERYHIIPVYQPTSQLPPMPLSRPNGS